MNLLIPNKKLALYNIDDNCFFDVPIEELFNASKYKKIKIVSYVASPDFFEKMISGFEQTTVIIGIDDAAVHNAVLTGIINNYEVKGLHFFEESSDFLKEKIVYDTVKLRVCRNGIVAHSKIYLLEGEDSYLTMCGSSNLTNNAFGIGKQQYEDLWVSHSEKIYRAFEDRFNCIYQDTIDFIPNQCKELWKNEKRNADQNEQVEIKVSYLDDNREDMDIDTEQYKSLKELSYGDGSNDKKREAERVVEIIKHCTMPAKNKIRSIKPINELHDAKPLIGKVQVSKIANTEDKYPRTELIYSEENNLIFATRPGIDFGNAKEWGESLELNQIKERLEIINEIVSIYKEYTVDNNDINARKAYEIILHAFFSPFMWKLRGDCQNYYSKGEKNIAAEVANILVINGSGKTGKSALLSVINKLLQNSAYEIPKWQEYKRDKFMLDSTVKENNIYPLVIDEIEKDFIGRGNSNWKGERWIKAVSNEMGGEEHPYIITASNQSIDLTSPLRRRVNYISLNSKLDGTSKMRTKLSNLINQSDNLLFKDFCNRMLLKIETDTTLYKEEYEKDGIKDFIAPARAIFKEYYKECGMDIPSYFPEVPFDDYSYNGKMMWRDTYLDKTYSSAFNHVDGEIIVNMEELTKKMYSKKPEKLKMYLNEYIKRENNVSESNYIHLDADKFFSWISVSNPYNKAPKNFVKRIVSQIIKI